MALLIKTKFVVFCFFAILNLSSAFLWKKILGKESFTDKIFVECSGTLEKEVELIVVGIIGQSVLSLFLLAKGSLGCSGFGKKKCDNYQTYAKD
jgi:hypothetical protein